MIRSATTPASRGRSSGSAARQSLARATSSASAPQASSRARASAVSPRIALRRTSSRAPPGVGRLAGEDLAEDRAQAEDVGPLVDALDSPPACSGAM